MSAVLTALFGGTMVVDAAVCKSFFQNIVHEFLTAFTFQFNNLFQVVFKTVRVFDRMSLLRSNDPLLIWDLF